MATLIQVGTAEAQSVSVQTPISTALGATATPVEYCRTEFLTGLTAPMAGLMADAPLSPPFPAAHLPAATIMAAPVIATPSYFDITPPLSTEHQVRRSISPIRGKALEKLGHAIEYLTDELAFESAVSESAICCDSVLQAILILKSLNRQVYFDCPVVEPLSQRIFSLIFPA